MIIMQITTKTRSVLAVGGLDGIPSSSSHKLEDQLFLFLLPGGGCRIYQVRSGDRQTPSQPPLVSNFRTKTNNWQPLLLPSAL